MNSGLCSRAHSSHNTPHRHQYGHYENVKSESDIEQASARLMAALDALDAQTKAVLQRMENARNAEEVDEDRARLAADLDAAQARADQLEVAAKDAGLALDAAIADVRSALGSI
jgi:Domain of unknown function (DUF4164)